MDNSILNSPLPKGPATHGSAFSNPIPPPSPTDSENAAAEGLLACSSNNFSQPNISINLLDNAESMDHSSASLKRNRNSDSSANISTDLEDIEQHHHPKRNSRKGNNSNKKPAQATPKPSPPGISTSTPTSSANTTPTTVNDSTLANHNAPLGDISNVNNSNNSKSEVKQYSLTNQGPFVGFAEPIDSTKVKGHLHPTTTGRLLAAKYAGNLISVSASGSFNISITLNNMDAANRLLKDETFSTHNLRFSIPSHCLNRQAVIRDIPLNLSEAVILNELSASYPNISKAERLNRRITSEDSSTSLVPFKSIRLTFEGQNLPDHIYLFLR